MWVKFKRDFDWRERPTAIVAYKKGMVKNVTKRCGEEAIAAGAAEETKAPSKAEAAQYADTKGVRPRADGQHLMPTEAELGEPEAPSSAAAGAGTTAGGTTSAT